MMLLVVVLTTESVVVSTFDLVVWELLLTFDLQRPDSAVELNCFDWLVQLSSYWAQTIADYLSCTCTCTCDVCIHTRDGRIMYLSMYCLNYMYNVRHTHNEHVKVHT